MSRPLRIEYPDALKYYSNLKIYSFEHQKGQFQTRLKPHSQITAVQFNPAYSGISGMKLTFLNRVL